LVLALIVLGLVGALARSGASEVHERDEQPPDRARLGWPAMVLASGQSAGPDAASAGGQGAIRCRFARQPGISNRTRSLPQGIVCDDLAALIERLAAHEPGFRLAG
jgi:hypothetical protein